ncbi:hypothetical protein F4810DRAFT_669491 [Camillea tinctor]|nr:hypothetical protein F4810DRAFT_669491 [Camillea tinctor]
METLRQLAEIPQDRFQSSPDRKFVLSAQTFISGSHTFMNYYTSELRSIAVLLPPPTYNTGATFTLLSIRRNKDEKLMIDHDVFSTIFQYFKIERRFLQLVRTNRYGLHYDREGDVVSYYIGTALYTIMWSFDVSTRETCAILLSRYKPESFELDGFQQLVKLEAAKLHSPFFLAWDVLVHLSNWLDRSTYISLIELRKLEGVTGYGFYGNVKLDVEASMEELTQASKHIGSVQVKLANQSRHIAIALSIATHLATQMAEVDSYATEIFRPQCCEELKAFSVTMASLQRCLNDSSAYVSYLQERVKSQSSVVYALMTHQDARTSMRLAQASKDLAEAAKKDTSSMKTIAVMTMLFLPGTYFAALWAVPSLQWGQPGDVIQGNFWVYWAFTLPCTVAVFAVWLGLHRGKDLPHLGLSWARRRRISAEEGNAVPSTRVSPMDGRDLPLESPGPSLWSPMSDPHQQ